MKAETMFRRKVVKWLKETFKRIEIISIQQIALCGDPDLVICLAGKFLALEIKTNEGKLSELQRHKINKIREAKGEALVVNPMTWDMIKSYLKTIYKEEMKRYEAE